MPDTRLDQILRRYLQQHLTVVKSEMDRGKEEIIKVVELIMRKVEEKDPRFKMELKFRGSVYEKVKIKKADEFDFDLPITLLAIEECPRGRMAGVPSEYTTYAIKPELQETWKNHASPDGKYLSAERLIATFAGLIKHAIDQINRSRECPNYCLESKSNHPAVTVCFKRGPETVYDVDLAPVIEVKKWPVHLTKGWENRGKKGWPSSHLMCSLMEKTSVYLVPKLYRDKTHEQRNYLWRYAFNRAEKKLLLESDGGEANNCRRNVLRILKGFLLDLKWPALRSYHMKTVLLHESETWPGKDEWKESQLTERVLSAVRRLRSFVAGQKPKCQHYFLTDINIMVGVNDQQKELLVTKLKEFLDNPLAAVLSIVLERVDARICTKCGGSCN